MKIGDTIYLDHQATTPVDRRVLAEMMPYFGDSFGNPHSSDHLIGWQASRAVEDAAARIGRLIGGDAAEITFTSGATESNNLALLGLGRCVAEGKRRRILLSDIEHKSVLAVGRILAEHYGFAVESIPVDGGGFVSLPTLEATLDDDVLAVSVMAVNNEIGTIQDIKGVSRLTRDCGALFHCDATQAPVAMSMEWIGRETDILCLSSHKMYGPKGVGVIFISQGLQDRFEPLIYGGGQQDGLRSGTVPVPLCVGMGAAADLLIGETAEKRRSDLQHRRDTFVEKLLQEPKWPVLINGPSGSMRHPGNVNVRFTGFTAHDILSTLQPRLAASTGSACTTGTPEPSHVLKAIGLSTDEAESSIRFSLGFDTTDEDIEEGISLLEEALTSLSDTIGTRSV